MERFTLEKDNTDRVIRSVLLTDVSLIQQEHEHRGQGSFEEQIQALNVKQKEFDERLELDIKEFTDTGYQAGFDEGIIAGKNEGKRLALEENQQTINKMQGLVDKIELELLDRSKEMQTIVVESIGIALKNSYFANVAVNKDIISSVVEQCLSSVPIYAKTIVVSCSKSDFDVIKEYKSDLKVIVDKKLQPGEVSVNTDVNFVKITGEQMAKNAVKNILGTIK